MTLNGAGGRSKVLVWLREVRPAFFGASVVPVLVGTAAGFAASGRFHASLFVFALVAMVLLHAAANVANDYFDHASGNDPANRNVTPFSGGSRVIQEGLLSPREVLAGACMLLAGGAVVGVALAALTGSLFIGLLVLVGVFLGQLYSAPPVRLAHRGVGEIAVALGFGVLPVAGAFTVQTGRLEAWVLVPGVLVGILIFCVLLVNEFPDESADRAVGKRTLVVRLGRRRAVWVYRIVLLSGYVVATAGAVLIPRVFTAGVFFLATLPLVSVAFRFVGPDLLAESGKYRVNLWTVLLHLAGGVMLTVGFVISGLKAAGCFG